MYNRELSDTFCKYWPFSMQWKIELWFRNTFGYWLCNWKSKPLCAQHIANLNSVMMIHDIQKLSIAFNRLLITTFVHYIGNDFLTNNDDLSFYSMSCQWIFSWILFFFNTHIAPTKKKIQKPNFHFTFNRVWSCFSYNNSAFIFPLLRFKNQLYARNTHGRLTYLTARSQWIQWILNRIKLIYFCLTFWVNRHTYEHQQCLNTSHKKI